MLRNENRCRSDITHSQLDGLSARRVTAFADELANYDLGVTLRPRPDEIAANLLDDREICLAQKPAPLIGRLGSGSIAQRVSEDVDDA